MHLITQALTSETFAPYGEVVEHQGSDIRRRLQLPFSIKAATLDYGVTVNKLPHRLVHDILVDTLERHTNSAQTFIPMVPGRHLVVVALSEPTGELSLRSLKAFITNGRQGVVYRPSVWHYAFTAIDAPSEVAVILGKTGQPSDTEYTRLAHQLPVFLHQTS
jgi:ureidoglycolate lyase